MSNVLLFVKLVIRLTYTTEIVLILTTILLATVATTIHSVVIIRHQRTNTSLNRLIFEVNVTAMTCLNKYLGKVEVGIPERAQK